MMPKLLLLTLLGGAVLRPAEAVHACDSEQGSACPTESGKTLGGCLNDSSKHEAKTEISAACSEFIKVNEACDAEIEKHCSGGYYTDDTLLCLTQWTQAADLSEACKGALPKKEEEKTEEVDAEKAAWRAKRKAVRESAKAKIDKEKKKQEEKGKRRRRGGRKGKGEDL